MQHKWRLLRELWSLALVPAAFAVFVVVNGGIVVGDRNNHTPVLHLMQLPYLLLFAAGALAPVHFNFPRYSVSHFKVLWLHGRVLRF